MFKNILRIEFTKVPFGEDVWMFEHVDDAVSFFEFLFFSEFGELDLVALLEGDVAATLVDELADFLLLSTAFFDVFELLEGFDVGFEVKL